MLIIEVSSGEVLYKFHETRTDKIGVDFALKHLNHPVSLPYEISPAASKPPSFHCDHRG